MDLRKEILKEHTKTHTVKLVKYVGDNPTRFAALVNVFLEGPYRVTQRAAWVLSYCVEAHPALVKPHLKKILDNLRHENLHDAVKRNTVRLLTFIDIPQRYVGHVLDICFGFLQDKKEPVAVQVFSMIVLSKLVKSEPELKQELKIIVEDLYPYGSAAFRSRARHVLAELK